MLKFIYREQINNIYHLGNIKYRKKYRKDRHHMDIFSIMKNNPLILNIDIFEKATKKKFPYYQYGKNNKLKLYARCPECGNPIQIINLYGAEMIQNETKIIKTYAKHTSNKINGFTFWNETEKENCSLYKPTPLGNSIIKHNDAYSKELKELIERNKRKIFKDIREIVSINLSNQILDGLYDSFLNTEAYTFKAVTMYNIPYAILYYQQSTSLYGQYILSSSLGKTIAKQINENSQFFKVEPDGKIVKETKEYKNIDYIFTKFKNNGTEKTVTLEIFESLDDNQTHTILCEKINLKSFVYS